MYKLDGWMYIDIVNMMVGATLTLYKLDGWMYIDIVNMMVGGTLTLYCILFLINVGRRTLYIVQTGWLDVH